MKRLILVFLVPTYLWAIDYGVERYYNLPEYVAYELEQCPTLVTDIRVSADRLDQAPSYDSSSIFVCQQMQPNAISNGNIGGGIFVVGFAVVQCMDWWIKRNRRIQQFVAIYSAWTRDDYQRMFEGSCHGATYNGGTDQHERQSWHLPDEKIFTLYHHYQFVGFRQYLKTRRGYEQEILNLIAALERKDKKLRKAIKHMPGCSRTQFVELINDMASDVQRAQAIRAHQKQKEQTLRARREIVQQVMSVVNRELIDILTEPRTWRAIGKLTESITSEITREYAAENVEIITSLDLCSTCTTA